MKFWFARLPLLLLALPAPGQELDGRGIVSAPLLRSKVEPSYSGVNATVGLKIVVGAEGVPVALQVMKPAGFGLDEKAIEAVQAWRFEPGRKDGWPVNVSALVDVSFHLWGWRDRQSVRLNFPLPAGAVRPRLIEGRIPANPPNTASGTLRIHLSVGPAGMPGNLRAQGTADPEWADRAIREMREWKFRPALVAGEPTEVEGVLELTALPAKETLPIVSVPDARVEDASLPAPKLVSPADKTAFEKSTRRTTFRWEAVAEAVSYLFEWDYWSNGVWHAEDGKIPGTAFRVTTTNLTFNFVGALPGRWRVWAVNADGKRGNPSEWRTFQYLK